MKIKMFLIAVITSVMLIGCGAYTPVKGDMSAPPFEDLNFETPNWYEHIG